MRKLLLLLLVVTTQATAQTDTKQDTWPLTAEDSVKIALYLKHAKLSGNIPWSIAYWEQLSTTQQPDTKHTPWVLSAQDSARINYYWGMANRVRLGSQQRQLYLDSALAIAPWNARMWQQKAMPLSKALKHELAAPYLDSAVKYNPKRYMDYRAFMKCIFRRHYADALKDFHAAKALNGSAYVMDHPYEFYMGLCHLQLNNYDSAKYMFQKCIADRQKKFGDDWVHYIHPFYLGIVYYETGEIDSAISCFDVAAKLNATFPDAKLYKAFCFSGRGAYKEALDLLYEAEELQNKGHSMNEDNARYVWYPYQMRPSYLQAAIRSLEGRLKKDE